MAEEFFTETINTVQDTIKRVVGIEHAPHLDNYPLAVDSMLTPCALTQIVTGSRFDMSCPGGGSNLSARTTVYLAPFGQQIAFNPIHKAYELAGAWRAKFLSANTYVYEGVNGKQLIDREDLQMFIDGSVEAQFTGYQVMEYPVRSGKFYHAFALTYGLNVSDIGCSSDEEIEAEQGG